MVDTDLAPIVLFVYNRPWHTKQTLSALKQNDFASESKLFIYCDGPKPDSSNDTLQRISEVRKIIREKQWCKEVHIFESELNKGLASSVITGVSYVINKYGKIIVLEDDIVTSKFFLKFMNGALSFYEDDKRIFSIGGGNYIFPIPKNYKNDIFIAHRTATYGWGTWSDRWEKSKWNQSDYSSFFKNKKKTEEFNRGGSDLSKLLQLQVEGKIDSWAIKWDYCHYINNAYCLRPIKSFVKNIGFDSSGTHCMGSDNSVYSGIPYEESVYNIKFITGIKSHKKLEKNFKAFFDSKKSKINVLYKKVLTNLRRIWLRVRKKIKLKTFCIFLFKSKPVSAIFGLERGTPIDRFFIEYFLNQYSSDIKKKVLEVSESVYSKKYGKDVTSIDILHINKSNQNATIIGDLSDPISLPENKFDCFICTQTLHFIFNIKSAITGCYKLLNYDGVFLGTVPGISQISRYDMDQWGDYWRFSDLSIRKMFDEVFGEGNVEIITFGNALAATAFLQGLAVEEIPIKKRLLKPDNDYQVIIGIRAIKR